MPVTPDAAYALLKTFGQLEYELKKIPGFTASTRGRAQVRWSSVQDALSGLSPTEFLDRLVCARHQMLSGGRDRPMVEIAVPVAGGHVARYQAHPLSVCDARALLEATRRVRNNLFHGGKEDVRAELHPGDDDAWVSAACDVAAIALELVKTGKLHP